jgi:hypothetical protein
MKTIQLILIGLSALAAILGSVAFRSKLAYRVIALLLFFMATGFVMFPDTTTELAHSLGVGRGADLLLYVVIFAGVHSFLLLYMRTRRLERHLTELIRANAITKVEHPELKESKSSS